MKDRYTMQGANMYIIRFRTSKIVAARFSDRGHAKYWLSLNDFDPDTGECLGLFELVHDKQGN